MHKYQLTTERLTIIKFTYYVVPNLLHNMYSYICHNITTDYSGLITIKCMDISDSIADNCTVHFC